VAFDMSIILEDSAFHDFISTLCKLSLEMVSMQSCADVGAGGEGALDLEDNGNIPSASTSMMSLATSRMELFSRRRVSGIHILQTLVCAFFFYLSLPIF
jgi:hypothetical protein